MLNKTKAALQSCQCHYQMFKQAQNTRVSAGGQSLSEFKICNSECTPAAHTTEKSRSFELPRLGENLKALKSASGFSSNRGEVSKTYIRQWRTLEHTAKNYSDIGWYHSLSASFACLRWRRLISPLAAVTRKPAVLRPLVSNFQYLPSHHGGFEL